MTTTQIGLIDIQEARQASQFFMRDGQVIELRALDATLHSDRLPYDKPRVIAGWFDNVDALVAALPQIASAGGIYITINPCQPALLARANNRLKDKKVTATTDEQIVTRQYLLIDADPERDGHVTGVPANDTEHQIALDFVQSICAELANEGWPDPLRFDSGNGGYALYAIDLPASDDGLVERVLKGLALRFNTAQVHIDLTSYNQSRIMRLPGTWNCKGDGTEDRPHRLSKIISIPDEIHPVAIDLLETIAVPIVQEQKPTSKKDRQPPDYLDEWNIAYGPQLPYNGGSKWQLTEGCPFCGNNDHNVFAYISPHGKLGFKCSHNSCTGLHWQELRLHFEPTAYDKQNNLVPYIPEPQQSSNGNGNGKTLPNPLQSNPVRNPDSQRSEIIINNAQLRDTTSAAMSALHSVPATNERVFVHFSQLSRVVKDEDDRPIVQQMNVASVKGELSEAADFYRVRK
ncbi:MAG TPA: hypothetical protein VK667_13485, partial [Ktedonobacteraceae bacterium]|nr:hypothetical protein [Ktedonobacteraceae bacterium]